MDTKENETDTAKDVTHIGYPVESKPAWYLCIVLGFQHYVSMWIGALSVPFLISDAICIGEDYVAKSELVGTFATICGINTLIQVTIGVRLPIVQAGTFALLSPTLSYLSLPENQCPKMIAPGLNATVDMNSTDVIVGSDEHRAVWTSRLTVIQGSMMVAAVMEILLGLSGAMGVLLRFIGPLTICPTIALLGLSLFRSAANYAATQWWICLMTVALMALFSQYIGWLKLPCPGYSSDRGCFKTTYPVFKMFPVFLSVFVSWFICYILTITDVLPDDPDAGGYWARTDVRIQVLTDAPWVRLPYPGQWGAPRVDASLVCGLMAGILASMVESVGDYYACARLADAPTPPRHAINRGIGVEGFGCLLAGAFGTGNGTTSTSVNIGVIGLTRCGSVRVIYYCSGFLIVLGLICKFGALFITIPDPIIGGSFFILFGMIVAVGISNLQYVDMNSGRNLFIFGFSFFFGLSLGEWIGDNPDAIDTGNKIVDDVFTVLLSTSMFVGGVLAFFLDNTIKGTAKERGLAHMQGSDSDVTTEDAKRSEDIYGLPLLRPCLSRHSSCLKYIPFCPTYSTGSATDTITNGTDQEDHFNADPHDSTFTLDVSASTNHIVENEIAVGREDSEITKM